MMRVGPFQLLDFFILFSGALSVLMSVAHLARPNRKFANSYFGVVFFGTGFFILYFYVYFSDPVFDYSFLIAPLLFLLLYATSPFHYIIAYKVIIEDVSIRKRHALHFVPAIAAAALAALDAAGILNVRMALPWSGTRQINVVQYFLLLAWLAQILAYELTLVAQFFLRRSRGNTTHNVYSIIWSIIYLIVALGLVLASQLLLSSLMALSGLGLVSILVIVWYIFTYRYPDLYPNLNVALGRYQLTHTRGLDHDSLRTRMHELMEKEKIYCDEDLSLTRLAALLDITPHQLSEFLNRELGESFSTFLNRHRVEEAQRLLREDPARPVLSVAFAVGFNSKSVFYRVFTKYTNMSPQQFRKDS